MEQEPVRPSGEAAILVVESDSELRNYLVRSLGSLSQPAPRLLEARDIKAAKVILAAEEEVAQLETSFAAPEFYESHKEDWKELEDKLAAEKKKVSELYARWEELEALKAAYEAVQK